MEWISVKDKPLFISHIGGKDYWECTSDGEGEFLAAIQLQNNEWWIKHCVIEDEVGLMIVGDCDDENSYAGYGIEDVEFYAKIEPPKH